MVSRITSVNTNPQIQGVQPLAALANIVDTLHETRVLLMHVNNAVADLEATVSTLESRLRQAEATIQRGAILGP